MVDRVDIKTLDTFEKIYLHMAAALLDAETVRGVEHPLRQYDWTVIPALEQFKVVLSAPRTYPHPSYRELWFANRLMNIIQVASEDVSEEEKIDRIFRLMKVFHAEFNLIFS